MKTRRAVHLAMEILIAYILLVGVLLSTVLLVIGLTWHWAQTGHLRFEYPIMGMNLFEFISLDIRQIAFGPFRPKLIVNLGIAVVMFTPYARVLASMLYFALVDRNQKYTLFTGFVLIALTYSLFLR
jgi:uncharacterized membrane protein